MVSIWLKRLREWLNGLLRKSPAVATHRILRTETSPFVVLRQIEPDYEDDISVRIRYWRCIFINPSASHDLFLFCDRLRRTAAARRSGDITSLVTTHRFTVLRVSRMVVQGKRRTDVLMLADLDCVGASNIFRGLDGCALPIIDSLALQLKKRQAWDLDMLVKFEDDHGKEIPKERRAVTGRWLDCLRYYHSDYCK